MEKKLIPKKIEIKDILYKHHDNHLYQGRDGTFYSILEENYDWVDIKKKI